MPTQNKITKKKIIQTETGKGKNTKNIYPPFLNKPFFINNIQFFTDYARYYNTLHVNQSTHHDYPAQQFYHHQSQEFYQHF